MKSVIIMDGKIEPFLKHAEINDSNNFAMFFYSNSKVHNLQNESFEHVFIDGTKSCLPFSQRYQLLMVNFYLEKGITTTGMYVLMKGSNEKLYNTVFAFVTSVIP